MKKENIVIGKKYHLKSFKKFEEFAKSMNVSLGDTYCDSFIEFLQKKEEDAEVTILSFESTDIYGTNVEIEYMQEDETYTQYIPNQMIKKIK